MSTIKTRDDKVIYYEKSDVTLIPFGNDNDLLIMRDEDGYGELLSAFTESTRAESNISLIKKLDQDTRGEQLLFIAKVTQNESATVRAVYSGVDDTVPIAVLGVDNSTFNELDAGNVITIGGYRSRAHRVISPRTCESVCKGLTKAYTAEQQEYDGQLSELKSKYLDDYLAGKVEIAFASIFTCRGTELRYTDTVIDLPKERLKGAVLAIMGETTRNFDQLFLTLIKAANCLKINGTKVSLEYRETKGGIMLPYINGKKIASPDVDKVLSRAICYPNQQAAYDDFVKTVSRVSMKFHEKVAAGVELAVDTYGLNFNAALSEEEVKKGGEKAMPFLPGRARDHGRRGYGRGYSNAVCKLKLRKEFGKKAQVHLLGKWRTITKFDMFIDRCEKPHRSGRRTTSTVRPNFADEPGRYSAEKRTNKNALLITDNAKKAITKLSELDNFLVPADRVIQDSDIQKGTGGYGTRGCIKKNRDIHKKMDKLGLEYIKMFCDSMKHEHDSVIKSREMLNRIVEETGTERVEERDDTMFIVTGESGIKYRIAESTGRVFEHGSNRALCIVNAGHTSAAGYDYIISLIAALAKDRRTAHKIYTVDGLIKNKEKKAPAAAS
jgi:hypothetical protein